MVVIRLTRAGIPKYPVYRIVVADNRCPRDGRNIECVGHFNPFARGQAVGLAMDLKRIEHWRSKGAQLSPRVASLVKKYQAHGEEVTTDAAA